MSSDKTPGLDAHADALAALRQLRNVCKSMDSQDDLEKPSEEQYQAAMKRADQVLVAAKNGGAA